MKWCEVKTVNYMKLIRVGEGRHVPPKKNFGKIFFGQLLRRIRAFSGKDHVKFGNFVHFSVKYHKNSGIFLIFRARIM